MSFLFRGGDGGFYDRIDWANVQNIGSGNPFTVSMWVKIDDMTPVSQWLMSFDYGSDLTSAIQIYTNNTYGIGIQVAHISYDMWEYNAPNAYSAATWANLIVTYDGSIYHANAHNYVNGTEKVHTAGTDGIGEPSSAGGKWSIGGKYFADDRNVDGRMAEVAVWDRILNSTEIAYLGSGHAPSLVPTDLIFYFSGKSDTLVAEVGGTGTADGAAYDADHPTIDYGEVTINLDTA